MNNIGGVLLFILFFILRISIKIFFDNDLDKLFIENTNYDNISREIIENGISISVSFLFVGIVQKYFLYGFKININPFVQFISIIIGTILTISLYKIYKLITNKEILLVTRNDRDRNKDNIVD
tara:strand:+ start:5866 stop:6234 length:369 start_codon:yes stop_codon:yes gene_type:complete